MIYEGSGMFHRPNKNMNIFFVHKVSIRLSRHFFGTSDNAVCFQFLLSISNKLIKSVQLPLHIYMYCFVYKKQPCFPIILRPHISEEKEYGDRKRHPLGRPPRLSIRVYVYVDNHILRACADGHPVCVYVFMFLWPPSEHLEPFILLYHRLMQQYVFGIITFPHSIV